MDSTKRRCLWIALAALLSTAGCAPQLTRTPNLYAGLAAQSLARRAAGVADRDRGGDLRPIARGWATRPSATATTAGGGNGRPAAQALRIGQVVLAALDIDFEVARQRLEPEQIMSMSQQLTVYTSPDDLSLAIAHWLFASTVRLGTLGLADIPLRERLEFAGIPGLTLIDARVSSDLVGHSYFYQNPAVSSDLILLLRDGLRPGAENGRPLEQEDGFWIIRDDYGRGLAGESTTNAQRYREEEHREEQHREAKEPQMNTDAHR